MLGSTHFQNYQASLKRVQFSAFLDELSQTQQQRRLSIVGPCYTHAQWRAAKAEQAQKQHDDRSRAAAAVPSNNEATSTT